MSLGAVEAAVIGFASSRRKFWLSEAVKATGLERRPVLRVLERLRGEGLLAIIDEKKIENVNRKSYGPGRREPKYEVVADLSQRRPGTQKTDTCRDSIWRTLRAKRMTTRSELQILTGCSEGAVQDFVKLLKAHGYVRDGRKVGREVQVVLVKDAGVRRPETPGK